jgi:hypothetical protein
MEYLCENGMKFWIYKTPTAWNRYYDESLAERVENFYLKLKVRSNCNTKLQSRRNLEHIEMWECLISLS